MRAALLIAAGRWAHFASAFVLFGASLYPVYAPTGRFLDRPLRIVVRVSAGSTLIAALLWLFALIADLFGDDGASPSSGAVLGTFFFETSFGGAWIVRVALMLFACLVCLSLRRNSWTVRLQARVLAATAAAIVASAALVGHAAASPSGSARGVQLFVQALHLLAAAAWLGGTVPLFIVVAREIRTGNHAIVQQALRRFSVLGIAAVAAVLGSGIFNTASRISGVTELTGSDYGRTLMLKIALFGALLALAAVNRSVLTPGLQRASRPSHAILVAIGIEWVLGLGVVAAAAVLGMTEPPH